MSQLKRQVNSILKRLKRKRDDRICKELFDLTGNHLMIVARAYVKRSSDVEDAVMRAFVKALKYADSFDERGDGYNWLCKIVQNEAISINAQYTEDEPFDQEIGIAEPDDRIERLAVEEIVEHYLGMLEGVEKEIVYLRFWEEKSYSEIAEAMGMPKSTVHKYMKKILEKLRKA